MLNATHKMLTLVKYNKYGKVDIHLSILTMQIHNVRKYTAL